MCSADAEGGHGGRLLSTALDALEPDNGFERRCEVAVHDAVSSISIGVEAFIPIASKRYSLDILNEETKYPQPLLISRWACKRGSCVKNFNSFSVREASPQYEKDLSCCRLSLAVAPWTNTG